MNATEHTILWNSKGRMLFSRNEYQQAFEWIACIDANWVFIKSNESYPKQFWEKKYTIQPTKQPIDPYKMTNKNSTQYRKTEEYAKKCLLTSLK